MFQIKELTIRNFMRCRKAKFDFSRHNFALILGPNGAGKTTIFSALCWCLFGKTPRGLEHDDVVNWDVDENCQVIVELDDNGTPASVARARKMKSGKPNDLIFYIGKEDKTHSSMTETQKLINDFVGMDYLTFTNSVIFPQGIVEHFAALTDAEQKAVLERILGLEKLNEFQKKAKKKVEKLQLEDDQLELKLSQDNGLLEAHIREKASLKESKEKWQGIREHKVKAKKAEIAGLQKEKEKSETNLVRIKRQMHITKKGMVIADEIEENIEELRGEEKKVRASRARRSAQIDIIEKEIKGIREETGITSGLEGKPICPVCGQKLTKDGIVKHVRKLEKKREAKEAELKGMEEDWAEDELLLKEVISKQHEQQEIKAEIETKKRDYQKLEKLEWQAQETSKTSQQRESELRKAIEELKKEANPYGVLVGKAEKKLGKLKEKLYEGLEDRKVIEYDLQYYDFWVEAFGNKGMKSLILDSVVPRLNERAAYYSSVMTGGNIKIRFHTQTPLKSGEVREKFGVDVSSVEGARIYKGLSGGEKKRADMINLMALRDLVQNRATKQFGLLLADEVFDSLDSEGIDSVIGLLMKEMKDGCKVYVISHNDDMKEYFQDVLNVSKVDGVSQIN